MKGYQWLRQSRLSKIEVQMFLGSCNMMDGYNNMKRNLIRIFTKKGRNGRSKGQKVKFHMRAIVYLGQSIYV